MKKTPEAVSRERQEVARQIKVWRAAIAQARDDPAKADFARAELKLCLLKMTELRYKGKRTFWV